jgi:adenylylsulfate kinase
MNNLYPISTVPTLNKEQLLNQKGQVLWLTGLSGCGKSTIAQALEIELHKQGFLSVILDGDNIRKGLSRNLGFSKEERHENIRRVSEVAKLFANNGIIVICCFISPSREMRALAKRIIGAQKFKEIYISTPLETCRSRDPKGLYAKAYNGEIQNFTGVSAPYEPPLTPALNINTSSMSVDNCVNILKELIV